MNINDKYVETLQDITQSCMELLKLKGDDYGNTISQVANLQNCSETMVVLQNCNQKIVRINNLLNSNKTPNYESVNDSIKDLINYLAMLHFLVG